MDDSDLKLADYPCESMANSQLALVVCQSRFPPVPRLDEKVDPLRDELRDQYPLFSDERERTLILSPGSAPTTAEGARVLRISSIDRLWSIAISTEYVAIETRAYAGIDDFSSRAEKVWRVVDRVLNPHFQLRFGLRFINELRHPEGHLYSTWRRLLNKSLLGFDAESVLAGTVQQTVSELLLDRNELGQFLMRRGFLKGTTVMPLPGVQKPSQQRSSQDDFYLLDLDLSESTPGPFQSSPGSLLQQYNKFLFNVFRWAIGSGELYQYLKGG